jgi:hypothetical protein
MELLSFSLNRNHHYLGTDRINCENRPCASNHSSRVSVFSLSDAPQITLFRLETLPHVKALTQARATKQSRYRVGPTHNGDRD